MPLAAATATITALDSTLLVDGVTTLSAGGKVYTFVSGAPSSTQIQIGAADPVTAANIAIRVTTDTATTLCTASAQLDVITLTANTAGSAGNSIHLSTTAVAGALTLSAFAGGTDATLVSVADVKQYLDQIPSNETKYDALLNTICGRVEDIIKDYLGFDFDGYTSGTTVTVFGNGTPFLLLPPHQAGSITTVVYEGSATSPIVGWTEDPDGSLFLTNAWPWGPASNSWGARVWAPYRYTVTGNWGLGATWPPAIKEVAVEVCVNIFRERDKGAFSDVIGVEAGGAIAVGYQKAFTSRQRAVLDITRRKYTQIVVV